MALEPASNGTWTFEVTDGSHLDAPQKAKSKVAEEHGIDYDYLTAKVVDTGHRNANPLVTVVLTPNR